MYMYMYMYIYIYIYIYIHTHTHTHTYIYVYALCWREVTAEEVRPTSASEQVHQALTRPSLQPTARSRLSELAAMLVT